MLARRSLHVLLLSLPVALVACTDDGSSKDDTGAVGGSDGGGDGGADGGADGADGGAEPSVATTLTITAPSDAEIGEWTPVTAVVLDQFGAEMDLDVTLSVSADGVAIDPAEGVQFGGDGVYVVNGTVAATDSSPELTGSSEPITVDSNGPVITVAAPLAASWFDPSTAEAPQRLTGQITDPVHPIASATLNGAPLALDADGNFDVELPATAGLLRIDITAVDTDGNAADRVLGVAQGPTSPLDVAIDPAVAINLAEGGLLALADAATSTFTASAVEAELIANNPLFSGFLPGIGSVNVRCTGFTWDSLSTGVRLDEGSLGLDLTITNLALDVMQTVSGVSSYSAPGSFTDPSTTLSLELSLSAIGRGDALVEATGSAITFTDPTYDAGGLILPSAIDPTTIFSAAFAPLAAEAVVPAIEAALEDLVLDAPLNVMGTFVGFHGEFNDIAVHPTGLSLLFDGEVVGPEPSPSAPPAPGSIVGGDPPPSSGAVLADIDFSLGQDLVNRIVHMAYQGGAFAFSFSAAELGLSPAVIELVFPGATTLDMALSARLPAALRPADGAFAFDLIEMDLLATGVMSGATEATELTHAAMHITAPVTLSTDGAGAIIADIGTPAVTVDVLDVDAAGVAAAEALEDRLGSVAVAFVGDLLPDLEVFAPAVPGFTLTTDAVAAGGVDGDWLTAACSVD